MTMIWCEGFEQYATTNDLKRNWVATSSLGVTSFTGGRHGGQRLNIFSSLMWWGFIPPNQTDEYWLGFAIHLGTGPAAQNLVRFKTNDTEQLQLEVTAGGELEIRRGATLLDTTSGLGLIANNWYYIEMHVVIDQTVGEYELRVNENVEIAAATGQDTQGHASVSDIGLIEFLSLSSNDISLDDIYLNDNTGLVNNDFLGDIAVETKFPDGDGNRNELTPLSGLTNYEMVDDGATPDDDTTYNQSSTVGDTDLYTFADLNGYGFDIDTIHAVAVINNCRKVESGERTVRALARSNVTEVEGAIQPCGVDFRMPRHIYETDPDGGGAWDEAAVNAAEFGITIEA